MSPREGTVSDLQALKADILGKMACLQQRLAAVELVLEELRESSAGANQLPLEGTLNSLYRENTLPEASLHALEGSPRKWWKVSEVTETIRSRGFPFRTGKPMSSVATALKRLADANRIERRKKGRKYLYRFSEGQKETAELKNTG